MSLWFSTKLLPVTQQHLNLCPFVHHHTPTASPLLHSTNLRRPFSSSAVSISSIDHSSNVLTTYPPDLHPYPVSISTVDHSINVLMTCPSVQPYLLEALEKRFTLHKLDTTAPDEAAKFLKSHRDSIRAVVGTAFVGADAELIEQLPKLEIVSSYSVGVDKIDLVKCKEKGIRVTNCPDVSTDDVADLAMGLMLAVSRRLCPIDRYVRSGLWNKLGDYELTTKFSGKTVGIIGQGNIGMAIAKRAEAFGCPISYFSRSKKPGINYKYHPNVIDLAANCDILVVACALTPETRHIINRDVIDALGPKGVLINIGRGPHVDEAELVSALVEGRLGGAGLDVYQDEPNVPEELFKLENVVLLPHVGSATIETRKAMADLVVGNLEAHFLNKPLLTPVV